MFGACDTDGFDHGCTGKSRYCRVSGKTGVRKLGFLNPAFLFLRPAITVLEISAARFSIRNCAPIMALEHFRLRADVSGFSPPQAIRQLPVKDIFMIKFKPSNQNNAPAAKPEAAIANVAEAAPAAEAPASAKTGRKKSGKPTKTGPSEDTLL